MRLAAVFYEEHIDLLGYDRNFTIYELSDQKSLMKEVFKRDED